jgi:hypothetical protein
MLRNHVKSQPPRLPTVAGVALLLLWASSDSALAYLDPGTGSIILQSLIAGIIGAAAVARMYWQQLKTFMRRRFGGDQERGHSQDQ